jgi:putative tryptophan/tyrosine transport system substrate-binding protein
MAIHIRRREFIFTLSGAAAWPLAARAQQSGRLPTIGFLGASSATVQRPSADTFVERLRELGWVEGRSLVIEYRWAEGRNERYIEISSEFVHLKVDVIVTSGTAAVLAVKQATSVIPIVFAAAGDPVGNGLVGSLARPGGNITGLSTLTPDLVGKRLELLRDLIPGMSRLAILGNSASPITVLEIAGVQAAARTLNIEIVALDIRSAEDIASAMSAIEGRAHALYVAFDPFTNTNRGHIATAALTMRLPTMFGIREYVEAGGLLSYGPSYHEMFRRAAELSDKILRGAKPADIPVEQPTKFELVINLRAAKAIGLTIPEAFLLRADEVIE